MPKGRGNKTTRPNCKSLKWGTRPARIKQVSSEGSISVCLDIIADLQPVFIGDREFANNGLVEKQIGPPAR